MTPTGPGAPTPPDTSGLGTPGGPGPQGPLILLDGMSLAFRAYFALPPDLKTSAGVVTNAVHGFASMLVNLIRDHHPAGVAVAFDLPGGTFRDEIVDDYKGGRNETPPDLLPQFDMIRDLVGALAIPVIEAAGFEADDVLATLATEARDRGHQVIIVTGDRDSYQLVEDPYIRVLYNRRGVSDYALYDEDGIEQRTGVRPDRYPLLAALRGDPSDNLPGVPGVGEKTAAKLVNQYGDLETLYAHLDALTPKLRQNLEASVEQVRINTQMIPLVRNVPLDTHVDHLQLGGWNGEAAREKFAEFELKSLWTRFTMLMKDGLLGEPAGGGSPGSGGAAGAGSGDAGGADGAVWDQPAWLTAPQVLQPADPEASVAAIDTVVARARAITGNVALFARWEADPGRSPLVALALTPEAVGPAGPAGDAGKAGKAGAEPASDGGAEPVVYLTTVGDPTVLGALAGVFGPGGVGVVGHDVKELMRSLLPLGVDIGGLVMDTAVGAYLLDPSTDRYQLAELAATHLGVAVAREAGKKGQGTFALEATWEADGQDGSGSGSAGSGADGGGSAGSGADGGGAADGPALGAPVAEAARLVSVVARLRAPLELALDRVGERALLAEIDLPLVRVLARMEVIGICADREVVRSIAAGLADEGQALEQTIQDLAGGPFNVKSIPQLRSVLYERLQLTPIRKTKTGFSTDARTLEQLRDQHPVIDALLRYRVLEKLRSTYGETLAAEVGPDDRIHATFRQTVARTGRLSSDRPNLHNIPVRTEEGRRLREAFLPSPGRRLLVADYDQVELRAIAHLSGDPGLTAAFAAGEDIHRTVASRVFGVDRNEVTPLQRSKAKMVSYGLAYGMEAYGLSQRLGVPVEEAQGILQSFFGAFPAVREYMERAVAEARDSGYTVTVFGRRRPLPDLSSTNYQVRLAAERQAMNAGIQGLAADLFKVALIRLDSGIEEGDLASDLVLQVHDEVILDVEPGEEEAVVALTTQALTGAADLSVPLKVAMSWGSSWAEAKGG